MVRGEVSKVYKVSDIEMPDTLLDGERLKFLLAGKELQLGRLEINQKWFEYMYYYNDPTGLDPLCCIVTTLTKSGPNYYATIFNDEWTGYELNLGQTIILKSTDFWSLARLISFNIQRILDIT